MSLSRSLLALAEGHRLRKGFQVWDLCVELCFPYPKDASSRWEVGWCSIGIQAQSRCVFVSQDQLVFNWSTAPARCKRFSHPQRTYEIWRCEGGLQSRPPLYLKVSCEARFQLASFTSASSWEELTSQLPCLRRVPWSDHTQTHSTSRTHPKSPFNLIRLYLPKKLPSVIHSLTNSYILVVFPLFQLPML